MITNTSRATVSPPTSRGRLEERYDPTFVAKLALREKQVQQSYRPIIGIHKWFARRPGSLFRGLLLAEFGSNPLNEDYWSTHDLRKVIADPFMGGGTTVFESLRLGLSVIGSDVNPMSYWLVRQAVEPLDLEGFMAAGEKVWRGLLSHVGNLYETTCGSCGEVARVKYFLWVKTCGCPSCHSTVSLFPGYRVAESVRHPREVYHCPSCDQLREIDPTKSPRCPVCDEALGSGNARRGKATCHECGELFVFAPVLSTPPEHRLFAMEYQCEHCYASAPGRQFKTPDSADHARVAQATEQRQQEEGSLRIPTEAVPEGDETTRLLRWGYRLYRELFNDRQLLGLGRLLQLVQDVQDTRQRHALATVFSDFLRYQNMLCRYDTYALKCQDIFSVHGFPVGLIACENNLPGIPRVGSGSFIHFIQKYARAKEYAQRPYETGYESGRKVKVCMPGESIESELMEQEPLTKRGAWLVCGPSQSLGLVDGSLDGVFTDPPYYDNVQYAELMDFCFVWLRQLLGSEVAAFERTSTRTDQELTGNGTRLRGPAEFTKGMSEIFGRMAVALKPGAPLVFTYHHNDPSAYVPIIVAILDSAFTCTAVFPAPAEMAASLHIAGTKSSILDSVFVCRHADTVAVGDGWSVEAEELSALTIGTLIKRDVLLMNGAGYQPTQGDILCLRAGYVAAGAVRQLAGRWDSSSPLAKRCELVEEAMAKFNAAVPGDVSNEQ